MNAAQQQAEDLDVFRRKPAQFAKIAPPEDHSQAD
jgi:hypothetical protein